MGVELEVGALLYALVRIMKPDVCIETGLYIGDSAEWIGKALADNGYGHLHTCDIDATKISAGRQRLSYLPVTVHHCEGKELISQFRQIDFAHIDSGTQDVRLSELLSLNENNITPLGIVAFHDACKECPGLYPGFASQRNWHHLVFPSLVGVAVFQRPE